MMQQLVDFIRESRTWSSAERGLDLFHQVAHVLSNHLDIDAGMIVYARRFIRDHLDQVDRNVRVYEPWGLSISQTDLNQIISSSPWHAGNASFCCTEAWEPVEQLPQPWQSHFSDAGIAVVGSWPITHGSKPIGAIVLGRRQGVLGSDEDILSLCAVQVSLIGELLAARRVAEDLSRRDPLTGILNRRGFLHLLPTIQSAAKASGHPLIVGMLDVNDFKQINDKYGHAHGDVVLADIAKTLVQALGGRGTTARFGGDEFVFAASAQGMTRDSIQRDIHQLFLDKGYEVSIGCSVWTDGMDWGDCMRNADNHLYQRKRWMDESLDK